MASPPHIGAGIFRFTDLSASKNRPTGDYCRNNSFDSLNVRVCFDFKCMNALCYARKFMDYFMSRCLFMKFMK
jgi:hypothetical protein